MIYDLFVALSLPMLVILSVLLLTGTHRATRLLTRDKIPLIGVPRELFTCRWETYETDDGRPETTSARRVSVNGKNTNLLMSSLAYLWGCDWCMSIWVGAGLSYLTWRWAEVMLWVLLALTASTFTGMLVKLEVLLDKKVK